MYLLNKVKQQKNIELYKYWNSLREGNLAPHRFQIDPSDICKVLSETFILEHEQVHSYKFRLAGTKICSHFGRELKHTHFLDLWAYDDRQALMSLTDCVTKDAAVGVCDFLAVAKNGQTISYETLLLPLLYQDNVIRRILGTMIAGSHPYWLGVSQIEKVSLSAVRLFWPDTYEDKHHSLQTSPNVVKATQKTSLSYNNVVSFDNRDYTVITKDNREFRVYNGGLASSDTD
ncbi:MAG: PAS domain-containing protein [Pseudomonadota bacterium]